MMVNIPKMGTPEDTSERHRLIHVDNNAWRRKILESWKLIYGKNLAINSPQVETLLEDKSLIPTNVIMSWVAASIYLCWPLQNAFSDRLQAFGFNLFLMLVVDLMHEFEFRVWKVIFIHLLRMLENVKGSTLHEVDQRNVISANLTIQLITVFAGTIKFLHLGGIQFVDSRQTCQRWEEWRLAILKISSRYLTVQSMDSTNLSYAVHSSCLQRFAARSSQCSCTEAPLSPLPMAQACKTTNAHGRDPGNDGWGHTIPRRFNARFWGGDMPCIPYQRAQVWSSRMSMSWSSSS